MFVSVRPAVYRDLEKSLKRIISQRDGGKCCMSKAEDQKQHSGGLVPAYILSPSFFNDNSSISKVSFCALCFLRALHAHRKGLIGCLRHL
jgi:hypothetical protein